LTSSIIAGSTSQVTFWALPIASSRPSSPAGASASARDSFVNRSPVSSVGRCRSGITRAVLTLRGSGVAGTTGIRVRARPAEIRPVLRVSSLV
jgi:hypothetical protein